MIDNRIDEIIRYVEKGYSIRKIAEKLQISTHTVKALIALYKNKKKIEFLIIEKP